MRNVLYLALTSFLLIGCSSDTSKKEDIEKQKPLIFADTLTPDKVKNTETIQKQETEKLPKVVEQPLKTPPAYLLKNKTVQQDEPKPCDTPTTEPCAVEIPTPKETQSTPVVEKKYHSNAANSILFQRLPATFVKTYDLTPPRGSSIGLVQAMLKYPVTGYFSSRFGKVIKQYQAKAKMNPTGKIDIKLWNRLLPKTKSAPDFQTRARELSMTIEPGTYSDCEFHWDKENEKDSKGLIWGVMALGLKDSQIQRVLKLSLHRASDKIKKCSWREWLCFS
jgi:peptidoglycan hydrolase-like protein with peptidoglycan-binding domain